MLKETIKEILIRDLNKLKTEIESYTDESKLWIVLEGTNNSAGNLCLHIVGNLKYYIGTVLGKTGYIRDRESEFNKKNVPITELLKLVDDTVDIVIKTFPLLDENIFSAIYPVEISNQKMRTDFFVIHLAAHLNYHLGQINYHRRLTD
jgi:hypothetical protein